MITITPADARPHIDRAFVMDSLARVHTEWGNAAWNDGDYPRAVLNYSIAARYSLDATREGR